MTTTLQSKEMRTTEGFDRPVNDWSEFTARWGGLHNFLLTEEFTGFDYQIPELHRIIEEVRVHPIAEVRSGVKSDAFDLTHITEKFIATPVEEVVNTTFVLAHFQLHPYLTGRGQIFEGLDTEWVDPWCEKLRAHGFTYNRVFPILFVSGRNSASNYHIDPTHQLAWQCYGAKQFNGLKEPDAWTTREQRGLCSLEGMAKPEGLKAEDTYAIVQPPGTFLWNAVGTPHWVETFDECAATLTLVHDGLRLNGELCPHAQDRADWLESRAIEGKAP